MTERVLPGPVVVLSGADCARIDGLLIRALRDARRRDAAVPASVVEVAADIHWAAARFTSVALVGDGSRTHDPDVDKAVPDWDLEERLSTQQAARLAGVSPSYLCRLIRRRDVSARVGHGGGYEVDAASLADWAASRQDQSKVAHDGRQSGRRTVRPIG